jgi:DNA polymerase I-like protein with 3'-5' exonuclease and polymerase domains
MAFENVLYDVESDGLLPAHVAPPFCMTRLHSLGILDLDTGETCSFVNDELFPLSDEDRTALEELGHSNIGPLSEGLRVLERAKFRTGHNIVDFDEEALLLVKPSFKSDARIMDTLVMARMCFADIKEKDFRMAATGKLEGKLIGQQGLEAWGQRLGLHKGDYKKAREQELKEAHKEAGLEAPTKEELHKYVWGTWNVSMHDYMMLDLGVNFLLYQKIIEMNWSHEAIVMEHRIHALMVQQERNGFLFDIEEAGKLRDHLQVQYDKLAQEAVAMIGKWYRPAKVVIDDQRPAFGENIDRRNWGEVTEPKRTISYAKANALVLASGDYTKARADTYEGAPFVKVELKEFNPNSRPQIIDRLKTLYGWEPQDFTENGSPTVDDEVLRNLAEHIPLAETLAEIFFYKKRLGQVADGQNGWLKLVREDERIHGRVNVGGTVSGRATHAAPNVSQVPGVTPTEFKDKEKFTAFVGDNRGLPAFNGKPLIVLSKWNDKKGEGKVIARGRSGGYGWDCRELFITPTRYKLVGCDLSGVEFRCLANLTYPFDDGELVDIVLNGDIHQKNADLTGIGRGLAKRLLYACVDMETTALTKEGWKHFHELRVGELVMTYNMEWDVKEWKPIQHLHHVKAAKRVRIKGRGLDVICTPDHRWATVRNTTVDGNPVEVFEYCRTDELTKHHRVIADAPPGVGVFSCDPLTTSGMWGCQNIVIEPVEDGDVWCMTTENGSFVMRRGNFVTITGNCMYGGGDEKLGYIIDPLASTNRQITLGKQAREKLMKAMPSLDRAIRAIKREKRMNQGTIAGLDGRRLYVRSDHSALNLRLQSDGALIAKKWCLLIDDAFDAEGWEHAVGAEYAFNSWSHDEVQVSVREDIAERAAEIMVAMAPLAGEHFKFMCPIAAESKIGMNWAETH